MNTIFNVKKLLIAKKKLFIQGIKNKTIKEQRRYESSRINMLSLVDPSAKYIYIYVKYK